MADGSSAPAIVGITADRRWREQADLFARRGVETLHGPAMRTLDLAADEALRSVTAGLVERPPQWLVATTGTGMRWWLEAAAGWGMREQLLVALGRSTIVGRGAKVTSALRQAGLEVKWRAPGESMAEVIDHLAAQPDIGQARVAVQMFDPDDHPATLGLRHLAGSVIEVPVYRWLFPDDVGPAERLIAAAVEGRLGAVTFTSQPAVRFLFGIAGGIGLADGLREACNDGRVMPACIGPVCAEAAYEVGIAAPVWPEPNRLPAMVRMVAERLGIDRVVPPPPATRL